MGATWRRKNKSSYLVTVHAGGEREFKVVQSKQDAIELVRYIHKQELAGINVVETIRQARARRSAPAPADPALRDALSQWIDGQVGRSQIRQSTRNIYRQRLTTWLYGHGLEDGRKLGDVPVNEATREMFGGVIDRVLKAGRSRAIIDGIRFPLRGCYEDLIERKVLRGPNPAADLRFFIGKGGRKSRRLSRDKYFTQEQGPVLTRTAKVACPRWYAFILTGLLAGLRWGESAALRKDDIDWAHGRLHVERTVSDKGQRIERCKDDEVRTVKATPALLAALREHIDAIDLEGLAEGWSPEQCALVFPTTYGNVLRYTHFLAKVWQPLLGKAGLPYRKYHATRHSFATWHLENDHDIRWVQAQMGHENIGLTADVYGHLQPERHDAAAAGIDRFIA